MSPNNRHCLCLFPMCRACSHLLVHFCELLQSQLTGGINPERILDIHDPCLKAG